MVGLLSSLFGFGSGWLVVRTLSVGTWDSFFRDLGWSRAQGQQPFLLHHFILCYSASMAGQYACAMSPVWQTPVLFICDVCACFFFTWAFLYESVCCYRDLKKKSLETNKVEAPLSSLYFSRRTFAFRLAKLRLKTICVFGKRELRNFTPAKYILLKLRLQSSTVKVTDEQTLPLQHLCSSENRAGDVGVQEQEQPGERRQPPGRLQGLHLRAGGRRGARAMAGAGHARQAVGE